MKVRENELRRAETDLAHVETNLATEIDRLKFLAADVRARLASLAYAADRARDGASRDPSVMDMAVRVKKVRLPVLEVDSERERAIVARAEAIRARARANEKVRRGIQQFADAISKLSNQISAEEAILARAEHQAKEAADRAAGRAPAPPKAAPAYGAPSAVAPLAPARDTSADETPASVSSQEPGASAEATPQTVRVMPRVQMQVAIGLQSGGNAFTAFSTNISDGGIFIATVERLDLGSEVNLCFSLPTGELIDTRGVVRWARKVDSLDPDSSPGLGIQFVDLNERLKEVIANFVASRDPLAPYE